MKKHLLIFLLSVVSFLLCACSPKMPEHYVAFYVETPRSGGAFEASRSLMLPVINKEVKVLRNPVLNIDSLSDCVVSQKFDADLDETLSGLFFRVKDEASIRINQLASNGMGRRLILVADGKPLGYCRLKKDFSRKDLFFIIMTPATGEEQQQQLDELCFELNNFILEFREYKENK